MASSILSPIPPPYDVLEWERSDFSTKVRLACQSWALQGYGTPLAAYAFYLLKAAGYVGGWLLACRTTPGLGPISAVADWWLEPLAFQKAILWSMLFEVVGLGCGSGPLTGRYVPPVGGFLYFLRPGTTKRALFPRLPVIGGPTRGLLEVTLYAALLAALGWATFAPALGAAQLIPIAVLLPLLGVLDKTIFLAARSEHYLTTVLCFLLISPWIAGAKAVHLALWFWAGVSKLNPHFPAVVGVMMSNGPLTRVEAFRRRMYRAYPDDLRPSPLATGMAHLGTLIELLVPLLLALGDGGALTYAGLVAMLLLHGFITSSVPMGVPLEWNLMMVYGGFFLFYAHADTSLLSPGGPLGVAVLLLAVVGLPLYGNLRPSRLSFLLAMRYYAGNWAYSVWFFKKGSEEKLKKLTKASPWPMDQILRFYDRATALGVLGKVTAFRAMHLHGRALGLLMPRAVPRLEEYEWIDGELIAGICLGWNFGDGHLHDEGLLAAVQAQCGFEEGELRCLFVEAQPLLGRTLAWRIADARTGRLDSGEVAVSSLLERQPWPAPAELRSMSEVAAPPAF